MFFASRDVTLTS